MTPEGATLREIVPDSREYEDSIDLRYRTMYLPHGLGPELARGAEPEGSVHVGAFEGERLVGYARLSPYEPATPKVYQVCVEPDREHRGIGTALMTALLGRALGMGADSVVLDARAHALRFYERLGFVPEGPEFLSPRTGTPHRKMRFTVHP